MKAFKSGLNILKYLSIVLTVVRLGACASSSPNARIQTDELAFSITGTWEIFEVNPMGKVNYTITVIQDGEKLSVTLKKPTGENVPAEGTIEGKNVEWRFSYESKGKSAQGKQSYPQTIEVQFRGTIRKDGTMRGNVFLQGKKGPSWTAKKISDYLSPLFGSHQQ